MMGTLLVLGILLVVGALVLGVAAEVRRETIPELLTTIRQHTAVTWQHIRHQPLRPAVIIITIFWLLMFIPLIDHLLTPQGGTTAFIIWALTIVPHEAGHYVFCFPFGDFIFTAGGSVWQVLFWVLLALYSRWRGYRALPLLCWVVVGHSFINLSVYIGDAQERELPLLFDAFDPERNSHDWWNLLRWTGLLAYDDVIASMSATVGAIIVCITIATGILSTWTTSLGRFDDEYGKNTGTS
jgi:hypothetical protein